MLRDNLSVKINLANGSIGTVRDILYQPGESYPNLPFAVMVEFVNYECPFLDFHVPRVVPIIPSVRFFTHGGRTTTRH